MGQLAAQTQLTVVQCWCGILFAVPDSLWSEYSRKNDLLPQSMEIHCPIGHGMTRGISNALKEAREELARTKARLDQEVARVNTLQRETERKERQVRGYKGVVARTKRGMCPCCSQKFKDLKEHMASAHPDWDPDKHAEALAAKAEG